ncbi:MAG: (Na+)-NQR maturation NqrM [Gammaproteobacteria bacterium]
MMVIFGITLFVMLFVIAAMAVGVLCGRKPLKGSCGGLNAIGLNGECKICGRTTGSCDGDDDNDDAKAKRARASQLAHPL